MTGLFAPDHGSGVYHCMGPVLRLLRTASGQALRAGVAGIPNRCAHPDVCTHGSCRAVAERYMRDMAERLRVSKAHEGAAKAEREREAA